MKKTVLKTIREYSMIQPHEKVLCALSGGADSLSLMLCLKEAGFDVCACHLNHCLRGEEADRDEQFCRDICREYDIPFISERTDAAKAAQDTGQSIETAARDLRYAFFDRCAQRFGADKIATAHNADDNLETMLFRLIRGTGTAGLAGIPPVRDNIIRPLIFVERSEIEEYLTQKNIKWRTDHTNNEDFCTRNKIRHQVIPALRNINPSAAKQASGAAVLLRQDEDALDSMAKEYPKPCPAKWITGQPEAVASRVIRLILKNAGVPEGETSQKHIRAVKRLCAAGKGSVSLPSSMTAEIAGGCLSLSKKNNMKEIPIYLEKVSEFGEYAVCLTQNYDKLAKSLPTISFSCGIMETENLSVRCWRPKDRMTVQGSNGSRSLKRLYSDRGISEVKRSGMPILCCGEEIVAAAGIGAAENKDTENRQPEIYWLVWEKEKNKE